MPIQNDTLREHSFLQAMYRDDYFPTFLVEKLELILIDLCERIEANPPESLEALYGYTHSATESINSLSAEFEEAESEIETAARECIAEHFVLIAHSYGFAEADIEELVAPREW